MTTLRERNGTESLSEFLRYLASYEENAGQTLPALTELSRELGVSVASLREQLEVARAMGLVEVRPRTGTRRLPYTFGPAVRQSLRYALAVSDHHFLKYAELRNRVEAAYWAEAVEQLTEDDKRELQAIVVRAGEKLSNSPIQVPHEEHRNLHLLIFRRLDNPFVTGLLEAYWDAYEAVGLNRFMGGYEYLQEVWQYHARMVDAICEGNYEAGYQALVKHTDLLYHRPA